MLMNEQLDMFEKTTIKKKTERTISKDTLDDSFSDFLKEKIFTNHKTYYKLSKDRQRKAMLNMAEQTTIFDFME